jgi:hypothetical protein
MAENGLAAVFGYFCPAKFTGPICVCRTRERFEHA